LRGGSEEQAEIVNASKKQHRVLRLNCNRLSYHAWKIEFPILIDWELSVQVIPFHLQRCSCLPRSRFERSSFFRLQVFDAEINSPF
jgi:hypothetical protein